MAISRLALRTVVSVSASAALLGGVVAPVAGAQISSGSSDWFTSSSSLPGSSQPGAGEPADGAPKNIIYMVGDGMGYNHIAAANLYETGQTKYQVEGVNDPDQLEELPGEAVQAYEDFNRLSMTTFQHENSYDEVQAWADHNYVNENFTDSAAAGTAMATGAKTENGKLGVGPGNEELKNTSEQAKELGKAAGVVSDVPFNHATPASWAAHNQNRNAYHEIAEEMISGELDVIMGAGHPFFDNNSQPSAEALEGYMTAQQYERLSGGETDFTFIEQDEEFERLAAGGVEISEQDRFFGLAQVNSTLQHDRDGESATPYDIAQNDVVDLATMSEGALNVLGADEDGFHLMIEGGAIDWAGHANDIARDIEEVREFNAAVETVVDWVEENSSWEETLLIVTADHETGYLSGQDEAPGWQALTGQAGETPVHEYYSGNHTNMVVPFFFQGAGSEDILNATTGTDPVRGDFIDNVTVANLTFNQWWALD